jgi:hypothetical protein
MLPAVTVSHVLADARRHDGRRSRRRQVWSVHTAPRMRASGCGVFTPITSR